MTKLNIVVDRGTTASKPASPTEGYLYYDTDEDRLERYSGAAWEVCEPSSATPDDHDHSGDAGDGNTFDAANLTSAGATDGYVLTADGASGAAWEVPAGAAVDAADVTYTPDVATDWDGDADPGNTDDALDQLAERVDDIELAGGGGDSTYTDVYASRPAASSDGNLFLPSDGFAIERDTGAAWVPWGPIFPLTAPVSGDFSWVNQNDTVLTATKGGVNLYDPANAATNYALRVKAVPSLPYVITALFLLSPSFNADYITPVFLGWRQSSDGKLVLWRLWCATSARIISLLKASDPNTDVTDYIGSAIGGEANYLWLRIAEDSTNRYVYITPDGQNWTLFHSVGRTDYLTADQVLWGVCSRNASFPVSTTLISWKET